jgi:serine/threonine-protein kinase HipA
MAKTEALNLFMNENYVGQLFLAGNGAMSLKYDKEYSQKPDALPISLSLSLRRQNHKGEQVYNYFDNLLPDGKEMRQKLARNMGASSDRPFDLLSAIGSDCVGALRFLPERQSPEKSKVRAAPLTNKSIGQILSDLKSFPLGLHREHEFRISLAGNQEKMALLYHQKKWKQPISDTPTTHIFKNPMGILQNGIDLSTSVENEWLCLKICQHFGLEVNSADIREFAGHRCLVVERFDRLWRGKTKLLRLPQEDFCQALGIASHMKYESDHRSNKGPKPGLKDILQLLNASDERNKDRYNFFKAQILFWLLAAVDGHGKNYSLHITPTGFKMTPFYDILSAYPALDSKKLRQNNAKLAMAIGDQRHYRLNEIVPRHFYQSARKYGIPKIKVEQMFTEIAERAKTLKKDLPRPKACSKKIYDSIIEGTLKKIESLT